MNRFVRELDEVSVFLPTPPSERDQLSLLKDCDFGQTCSWTRHSQGMRAWPDWWRGTQQAILVVRSPGTPT